jgi:hypothetical protein
MDNPVENYSHNYVDIHTLQTDNKKLRISTGLYNTFSKLFHGFKTEKDINLLTLHRIKQLWIKYLYC